MNIRNRLTSKNLLIIVLGIAAILSFTALIGEVGKYNEEARVSVLRTDGVTQVVEVEKIDTITEPRIRATSTSNYATYTVDGVSFKERIKQSEKDDYVVGSKITVCYTDGISRYNYEKCAN